MKHYVLGLVFNVNKDCVLLIHKLRPDWQRGRWNGIGGKVEEGETAINAMNRESGEETGWEYDWEHRLTFICPGGTVFVFASFYPKVGIDFEQKEDEELRVFSLKELPKEVMTNLKWIIPFCLANVEPTVVNQLCLGVDG